MSRETKAQIETSRRQCAADLIQARREIVRMRARLDDARGALQRAHVAYQQMRSAKNQANIRWRQEKACTADALATWEKTQRELEAAREMGHKWMMMATEVKPDAVPPCARIFCPFRRHQP